MTIAPFLELIEAGCELIRLHKNNVPYDGWADRELTAPLTAGQVKRHALSVGMHFGVRLRATDLVIDVDAKTDGGHDHDGLRSAELLRIALSGLDLRDWPTVLTPSGGRHHLMTKPADLKIRKHYKAYPGIDFLTDGMYIVAVGSSYKLEGFPAYEWDVSSPGLPHLPAPDELLRILEDDERGPSKEPGTGIWTPAMLAEFLSQLDPAAIADDEEKWITGIMAACHEVTGGAGEEEFFSWAAQDERFSSSIEIDRMRWRSFTPGRAGSAGIGTLRTIALKHGINELPRSIDEDDFSGCSEEDSTAAADELPAEAETDSQMLTRLYKVVAEGGKVSVMTTIRSDEMGHDQWEWYDTGQFLKLCKHVLMLKDIIVKDDNGRPIRMPVAQRWLERSRDKQTYVGTALQPLQGERTTDGRLNMWRGFAVDPAPGDWGLLKQHILEVLADGDRESYEYIMSWLARAVQRPDEPGEVALVMQGGQGIGKGILGSALARLFGAHGAEIRSREHLTGRFNYHLRDKVVLFADEAVWAGNKEAESILKGMITEKNLAYERKGEDIVWGKNRLHIIMASNEKWVVPVAWDDRRNAIFTSRRAKRSRAYFNALFHQLEHGGYEAMLHELLNRDISAFHVLDDRPNTVGLRAQKRESMKHVDRWLLQLIESDELRDMFRDESSDILKDDLRASYASYLTSEGMKPNGYSGLSEEVGRAIFQMLPKTIVVRITDEDGERKYAYRFRDYDSAALSAIKNAG